MLRFVNLVIESYNENKRNLFQQNNSLIHQSSTIESSEELHKTVKRFKLCANDATKNNLCTNVDVDVQVADTNKISINTKIINVDPVHKQSKLLDIPDWLVNLRHDATHGNVPHLDWLSLGVDFALQWLDDNYWSFKIQDLSQIDLVTSINNIEVLLKNDTNFKSFAEHSQSLTEKLKSDIETMCFNDLSHLFTAKNTMKLCDELINTYLEANMDDRMTKNWITFNKLYWNPILIQLVINNLSTLFLIRVIYKKFSPTSAGLIDHEIVKIRRLEYILRGIIIKYDKVNNFNTASNIESWKVPKNFGNNVEWIDILKSMLTFNTDTFKHKDASLFMDLTKEILLRRLKNDKRIEQRRRNKIYSLIKFYHTV
ncbi:unnamed protein product [Gordionus sp. m RMFG-2023]